MLSNATATGGVTLLATRWQAGSLWWMVDGGRWTVYEEKSSCASNCRPCRNSQRYSLQPVGLCNKCIATLAGQRADSGAGWGHSWVVWQRSLQSPPAKRTVIFRLRCWHLLFYVKMLQLCAGRLICSSILLPHFFQTFYLYLRMPQFVAALATVDLHFSLPLTIKLLLCYETAFLLLLFVIIIIICGQQWWHASWHRLALHFSQTAHAFLQPHALLRAATSSAIHMRCVADTQSGSSSNWH